jgi:hypothetical protein
MVADLSRQKVGERGCWTRAALPENFTTGVTSEEPLTAQGFVTLIPFTEHPFPYGCLVYVTAGDFDRMFREEAFEPRRFIEGPEGYFLEIPPATRSRKLKTTAPAGP